jgi:hypothetical protein
MISLIHSILNRLTIFMRYMLWSHFLAKEITISCVHSLHGHLLRQFGSLLVFQLNMHVDVSRKQSDNIGSHIFQHVMFNVVMNQVFSLTPAVDSGVVTDAYGVKTDKEFVNILEDNIREQRAMDKLISDCARTETSARIKDIHRALVISDWPSKPYYENQNFAENRYGTIKAATNRVMNLSGAPAACWLLALMYV